MDRVPPGFNLTALILAARVVALAAIGRSTAEISQILSSLTALLTAMFFSAERKTR